jgi:hypothetical protein
MAHMKAFGKLCIFAPFALIFLLPMLAHSDSQLPVNVDPRPSEPDLKQLISILKATPEKGWVRVNINQIQDVFTPTGLLVSTDKAPDSNPWGPRGIIGAYSGFAWDSRRGDLIIYGGGHANYGGNDVYRWHGTTLKWERASLPSDVTTLDPIPWLTVDGPNASPMSEHTYDNNIYLPIVDRFLTFGGAAFGNGEPYLIPDPNGDVVESGKTYRHTGPYFFDPARADGNKVGGKTGSHSQWQNPNLWVIGGEMWENRDVPKNIPGAYFQRHFLEGSTGYTQQNGKDVVFVHGAYALLSKYTINNIDDPTKDTWEQVGVGGDASGGGPAVSAYLPTLNLYVRISPKLFSYWNLSTPGPTNPNVPFVPNGGFVPTSTGLFNYGLGDYGMDYDAPRNRFLLWEGGGDVWALYPPAVVSPNGWNILKLTSTTAQIPDDAAGSGILGKWKYIAEIDAFMTLQDWYAGNIWIYKPENWHEPISNDPHITVATPTSKGFILPNDDIVVTAVTSNPASKITQVELLLNGHTLTTLSAPPYTTKLTSVPLGIYTFEAIATDNNGNRFISPRVSATVANYVNNPPSVSISAPLDGPIVYVDGRTVTLSADASDSDGHVAQVEFFVDGSSVGVATTAPYSVNWEVQQGSHTLTAVATDNTNVTAVSSTVQLNVIPPGNGVLTVLQDGLNGYSGTTDTYLDGYQTTYPKGSLTDLNSLEDMYNPLVRFAIFSNEGGPIPKGSTITYAALALYKTYYDYTYSAHPLLMNWVENKATWINAADGIPWHTPGAAGSGSDYAAKGSPDTHAGWDPDWVVLDVTDSVQSMSLGAKSNYGWQLLGTGPKYSKTFHAREYSADPTLRPKLTLQIDHSRPSVALTAPNEGAIYHSGDIITLSANANDPDGSVKQVEFFYNKVSLGVDTTAPYALTWSDAPAGSYKLTAVVTDNTGISATSAAVAISALPPGC